MGVMLSPAWRPFAKQLPESPLMRRTIAQYKPCQAGRKARFLFTPGGVSIPGWGYKQRGMGYARENTRLPHQIGDAHVTIITLAIHQSAGMEQGQESQGSLPHLQRAYRLLCPALLHT